MKKTKLENEFASEAPLHAGDNLSMEFTGRAGMPLVQTVAGEAPMSRTPVPTWPIEETAGKMNMQSFAGDAPLSRAPQKYFGTDAGNNDLSLSDRSKKQSY
jgi:hypothetical protein